MRNAATVLTVIGALGCWYFCIVYHLKTGGTWRLGDWAHNTGGRHLMQMSGCLGVLLTLIVAARVWPTFPGRVVITLVVFAYLVVQILWRCVLLHRAQHPRQRT